MAHFIAVLDACVLYPASIRDILLETAYRKLYQARWTEEIETEWVSNLLESNPTWKTSLGATVLKMREAIPDALVSDYGSLVESLSLPDPNDRHVLAAAIRCGAQKIVTANLKDFPSTVLKEHGIEAQHPDDFMVELYNLQSEPVINSLQAIQKRLKKPPYSMREYLERLIAGGLVKFVNKISLDLADAE